MVLFRVIIKSSIFYGGQNKVIVESFTMAKLSKLELGPGQVICRDFCRSDFSPARQCSMPLVTKILPIPP